MAMLEVKDLEVYYGMIQAIKGISFEVNQGEVIALIGANGAGKTTTLHTITGLLSPKKGSVMFEGTDITKIPAHKIVSMGMAHVPEGRRVFAELSVYENLKMGAYTRKDKNEIEESLANVYKRFPRLEERRNQMAGTLSGGEQQMLAMGRALMSKPKIILMDEPSMGLSPIFVNEIFDIIQAVSESGTTVLLVEQNAKKALSIADRAYVLETGKITMSGNAKDLLEDEAVKKAYLGESEAIQVSSNIVITMARQYGSGGKTIGAMLAKELGINCYSREILRMASEESGINERLFGMSDEKMKGAGWFKILSRPYDGELLPPEDKDFVSEENIFNYQAKIIKDLAEKESCVIVGRCADYVLKDNPNVVSVFVHADEKFCLDRAMERNSMTEKEMKKYIEKTDKFRGDFYRYHTGHEWADARNYDLCLNSGKLGFQKCVEEIKAYIKIRFDL